MVAKGKDNKPHIGIFGRRNVGKSSLVNAITGQNIAIVSPVAGTTTDPVKKSVEIFGIGPVILIDTAGIDDVGELGAKRIGKTQEIFSQIDLAVLVVNRYEWGEFEHRLVSRLNELDTPFVIVNNKSDEITPQQVLLENRFPVINVSAATRSGLETMISEMSRLMPDSAYTAHSLLGGIIEEGDTVLLVTPIDSEAPEGRMILPQMQLVRDVLDHDAIVTLLKEDKVLCYLHNNPAPKLVITDSQVFAEVSLLVPESVPLTSFSVILAHHKGNFEKYLEGTPQIDHLKENDHILILESCTHLTSCEDIGRVKIPAWLQKYTGKSLHFTHVSGLDKILDMSQFALVVQCGGCMVTRKQLHNRLKKAIDAHVPVTNYGMLIAYVTGIFDRVAAPFRK